LDLFANDLTGSFFVGNDLAASGTPEVVNNGCGRKYYFEIQHQEPGSK
jgi:hypothetical protein